MRLSKTLKKIHSGNCVRICGLGHYLPFFVSYAAHFGFDTIWLDLDHRAMTDREVQAILALCHQYDIDCMVRSPTREHTKLYRYLEDGAAGLMMPLVADAADAQFIVNCTKFPPMGNRGIDGAGIDGDFGLAVWNEGSSYTDDANRETFIVIQIETPQAHSQCRCHRCCRRSGCIVCRPRRSRSTPSATNRRHRSGNCHYSGCCSSQTPWQSLGDASRSSRYLSQTP